MKPTLEDLAVDVKEAARKFVIGILDYEPSDVRCSQCGEILEIDDYEVDHNLKMKVTISPCDKCLGEARDKGFNLGEEQGRKDAEEAAS